MQTTVENSDTETTRASLVIKLLCG